MDRIDANCTQAGRLPGTTVLGHLAQQPAVVLSLPRRAEPVSAGAARAPECDLDMFLVRRVSAPGQPERAMGVAGPGGVRVRNIDVLGVLADAARRFEAVALPERAAVERRERAYRGQRAPLALDDRSILLVDAGVATGATLRAAFKAARAVGASRVAVAVPAASPEAVPTPAAEDDEVIRLDHTAYLTAVGQCCAASPQVNDEELRNLPATP